LLSQAGYPAFENWQDNLRRLEAAPVRPQWTRAWLTAPFGSPRFWDHAEEFTAAIPHCQCGCERAVGEDPVARCARPAPPTTPSHPAPRRPHDRSFAANARAPAFAPNRNR
jgi:hypothetical protein